MIITLYGPDSYRRNKNLRELVSYYKSKYEGLDAMFFDLNENDSWEEVLDFLKQPSMFVSSKLAVIKGVGQIERKPWIDALKSYGENKNVFIIVSEEKKPTKKFGFLLKSPAKAQEFEELEGEKLGKFLNKKMKEVGVEFSPGAKRFFVSYLSSGKDRSWKLINELTKISLAGFGKVVGEDDLKKLIEWRDAEEMFFVTRNILGSRDSGMKLVSLERLISRGEDSAHVFNLLAYQARGESAEKLAGYDVSIKSGGLEYDEALLDFVL